MCNHLVERLITARNESALSQRKAAGLLGVSQPLLAQVERGNRTWSDERLEAAIATLRDPRTPEQKEGFRSEIRRIIDQLDSTNGWGFDLPPRAP